jgi:hypothetical protein
MCGKNLITVARHGNGAYRPGKSGGDSESNPTRNLWSGRSQNAGAEPAACPKEKIEIQKIKKHTMKGAEQL